MEGYLFENFHFNIGLYSINFVLTNAFAESHDLFFFSVITLMGKILFYKAWVEMNMTKPFVSKV